VTSVSRRDRDRGRVCAVASDERCALAVHQPPPRAFFGGGVNSETTLEWPAQTEVAVRGVHFVQEDSPDEIGRAIAGGMATLR